MNLRKGTNLELMLKDENGNLLVGPQNVLNKWKKCSTNQVLNVQRVHDVRQRDIQTAEPLVPESNLV
jgi:hypothetical protein